MQSDGGSINPDIGSCSGHANAAQLPDDIFDHLLQLEQQAQSGDGCCAGISYHDALFISAASESVRVPSTAPSPHPGSGTPLWL